jgi:hypothetical protein
MVSAGEFIHGDGEITQGVASVEESAITGESAPVIRPGQMNLHFWRPILASPPHLKPGQFRHGGVNVPNGGTPRQ